MKLTTASSGLIVVALIVAPVAPAHGDEIPPGALVHSWTFEPVPILIGLGFLALFSYAFWRLRPRKNERARAWRWIAAVAAVLIGLLAVSSPLDAVGEQYLISAHMLQHVLLADVAPALAVVAVSGPLSRFLLPKRLLVPLARCGPLRRLLTLILRPSVSYAIWAVSLGVWHVPAFYDAALDNATLHDLEHLCFAVGGTLVWVQLLGVTGRRSPLSRLGFLVGVYAFGDVLAYVLIFSFHAYYPAYAAQDERLFGIGALLDQKLAGVVMMTEQTLTLGLCALWLITQYRRERKRLESRARRRYLASLEGEGGS